MLGGVALAAVIISSKGHKPSADATGTTQPAATAPATTEAPTTTTVAPTTTVRVAPATTAPRPVATTAARPRVVVTTAAPQPAVTTAAPQIGLAPVVITNHEDLFKKGIPGPNGTPPGTTFDVDSFPGDGKSLQVAIGVFQFGKLLVSANVQCATAPSPVDGPAAPTAEVTRTFVDDPTHPTTSFFVRTSPSQKDPAHEVCPQGALTGALSDLETQVSPLIPVLLQR